MRPAASVASLHRGATSVPLVVAHRGAWGIAPQNSLEAVQRAIALGCDAIEVDVRRTGDGRIIVDVELKEDGYVDAAMAAITQHLAPDQFVVTSFPPAVLAQVKDCAAHARTGLLIGPRRVRDVERRAWEAGADFLAPQAVLARTGLFGWAERQRLAIWVWTVNEQRVLRALGNDPRVAAVITDRPSRALDVYKPLTRPTAGSRLSTSWEREPPGA